MNMNSSLLTEFGDCIFQLQQRQTDEDSTINLIVKKINDLESQNLGQVPRDLIKLKKDLVTFQNSEARDSLIKQLREIAGNFENKQIRNSLLKIEVEEPILQPQVNGRAKSKKRFGRGNYTIADEKAREHAIKLAEEQGPKEAANQTGFSAKNIKRWMTAGPHRKKGGGRKTLDPKMEDKLVDWIREQQRETKQLLTRSEIKKKAREISTVNSFKASKGWLDKFRKRHSIEFRPAVSETQLNQSECSVGRYLESNSDEDEDSNKENQAPYCEDSCIEQRPFSPFRGDQSKIPQSLICSPYQKRPQKDFDIQDFLNFSGEQNHRYDLRMINLEQNFDVKDELRNM